MTDWKNWKAIKSTAENQYIKELVINGRNSGLKNDLIARNIFDAFGTNISGKPIRGYHISILSQIYGLPARIKRREKVKFDKKAIETMITKHKSKGWSWSRIAKKLNRQKILSERGKKWTVPSLRAMLYRSKDEHMTYFSDHSPVRTVETLQKSKNEKTKLNFNLISKIIDSNLCDDNKKQIISTLLETE